MASFPEYSWDRVDKMLDFIELSDAENICKALVYVYAQHGRGTLFQNFYFNSSALDLITHLVDKETKECEETASLFRANSCATKVKLFVSLLFNILVL